MKKIKNSNKTNQPTLKKNNPPKISFVEKNRKHWLIALTITLCSIYPTAKDIYIDLFTTKTIEELSSSTIETISELKKLNRSYDVDKNQKAINRIVEIIIFNLQTQQITNSSNFEKTVSNQLFVNSSSIDQPGNWLPFDGLTLAKFTSDGSKMTAEFIAKIKDISHPREVPYLPFDIWWNKQVILDDRLGNSSSRKSLIMSYALYENQQNYDGIEGMEYVKEFNYLGYDIDKTGVTLAMIDSASHKPLRPKTAPPKEILNSLLLETIRGISGELVETLMNQHVKNH